MSAMAARAGWAEEFRAGPVLEDDRGRRVSTIGATCKSLLQPFQLCLQSQVLPLQVRTATDVMAGVMAGVGVGHRLQVPRPIAILSTGHGTLLLPLPLLLPLLLRGRHEAQGLLHEHAHEINLHAQRVDLRLHAHVRVDVGVAVVDGVGVAEGAASHGTAAALRGGARVAPAAGHRMHHACQLGGLLHDVINLRLQVLNELLELAANGAEASKLPDHGLALAGDLIDGRVDLRIHRHVRLRVRGIHVVVGHRADGLLDAAGQRYSDAVLAGLRIDDRDVLRSERGLGDIELLQGLQLLEDLLPQLEQLLLRLGVLVLELLEDLGDRIHLLLHARGELCRVGL
mmetsp:Transcript_36524/g.94269  ORF Transcript_36524/g.94269 Transcript_36524/m.94269 type:complete len:342 (+) Transcript_36524:325-1350(+)